LTDLKEQHMATSSFSLPVDVPWQLIAASPDMMDTKFCKGGFPPPWRSSLAIYAYEPAPDDLPSQLCNQKITYLKVTCSITGYQPTAEETGQLNPANPLSSPNPVPAHVMFKPDGTLDNTSLPYGDFADAYFACYGVLLNVAVFPSTTTVPASTKPVPASTTPVADTFDFSQYRSAPNPLTSGELTFTLPHDVAKLPLGKVPGATSYGLLINKKQLQIDLPLSRNVCVTLATAKTRSVSHQQDVPDSGTITAYLGTQMVFTAPLTASPRGGPSLVRIDTSSPITRLVVQSNAASYVTSLTYSNAERPTTLSDYPHIVDFEPKTRDLYQAATDQDELLTGSNSSVNTGKSMSNTSSSEMGLGLSGGYAAGKAGGWNVTGQLTGKWGNTSADSSTLQMDSSRERRETQGTTTNITQQYNLLTGYHAGTNRAAFLMLPRPHTLQATDYRTFVRGLRMIEGLQDFFLIVSRPTMLPGICIEASLETGHFPEDVTTQPPPTPSGPTNVFPFSQSAHATGHPETSPQQIPFTLNLPDPWIVDTSVTNPPPNYSNSGVPGVFYHAQPIAGQNAGSNEWDQAIHTFSLSISQSDASTVTGTINIQAGQLPHDYNADIEVLFQIAATQDPTPVDQEQIVVSDFLVTSRELCVCLNSCPSDNCVMIAPPQQVPYSQSPGVTSVAPPPGGATTPIVTGTVSAATVSFAPQDADASGQAGAAPPVASLTANPATASGTPPVGLAPSGAPPSQPDKHGSSVRSSIVYETKLKVPRRVLLRNQMQQSRSPAVRELMRNIQHHLLNSWRMPQRRAYGAVGFLESDYLTDRLRKRLPKEYLSRRIMAVKSLSPRVVKSLGTHTTVGDVLKLDLHRLHVQANVNLEDAAQIRLTLLGLHPAEYSTEGSEKSQPVEQIGRVMTSKKKVERKRRKK
jgi:hypothetical protein